MNIIEKSDFAERAHSFATQLRACSNFDELHAAWQKTYLPYKMENADPFSDTYRSEVLSLYMSLSGGSYSTENELCSTKCGEEDFRVGFPWMTKRLDIVSSEVAKVAQASSALYRTDKHALDIVEFGVGWGNLATPLAKAGQNMTVIDIDTGFLSRLTKEFDQAGLPLRTVHGEFIEAVDKLDGKYDAAIFQASFHHCLDFNQLLQLIRTRVLRDDGALFFFSEPVFEDYPFPWGLRYDGESLWAIMLNKWLELGFRQDFFSALLLRNGFFLTTIPPIGPVGLGWKGHRQSIPFELWVMPISNHTTFNTNEGLTGGRFCNEVSILPGLRGAELNCYNLEFHNFADSALAVLIEVGSTNYRFTIPPRRTVIQSLPADAMEIVIRSETAVPGPSGKGAPARGLALITIGCDKDLVPKTQLMDAPDGNVSAVLATVPGSADVTAVSSHPGPSDRTDEVKALEQRIDELTNSTSWKITRPLRSIMEAIRGN